MEITPSQNLIYEKPELVKPTGETSYAGFLFIASREDFTPKTYVLEKYTPEELEKIQIQKEIEKALSEQEQITKAMSENTSENDISLLSPISSAAKDYEDVIQNYSAVSNSAVDSSKAVSGSLSSDAKRKTSTITKSKTDLTNINKMITTDSRYDAAEQTKIIKQSFQILADWLDDYIENYDERVAEGIAQGHSELKLTFLLEIRKSIENVDFPVGFAPQENDDPKKVTLGSYNRAEYTNEFLNLTNHADNNSAVTHHFNRKILLNTRVYAFDRKYKTEQEAYNAVANGETVTYMDLYFSNPDVYYNFAATNLAVTLVHEFVHSTHINNEAVTYYTCETMEDDFHNKLVSPTFSDLALLLVPEANDIKYGDLMVPYAENFNLSFGHNLGDIDAVAAHGHNENMAYNYPGAYQYYACGNTLQDDKNELLNFAVVA